MNRVADLVDSQTNKREIIVFVRFDCVRWERTNRLKLSFVLFSFIIWICCYFFSSLSFSLAWNPLVIFCLLCEKPIIETNVKRRKVGFVLLLISSISRRMYFSLYSPDFFPLFSLIIICGINSYKYISINCYYSFNKITTNANHFNLIKFFLWANIQHRKISVFFFQWHLN